MREEKTEEKESHTETASIGAELFSLGLRATSKAGSSDQHYSDAHLPFPLLSWPMHLMCITTDVMTGRPGACPRWLRFLSQPLRLKGKT